MDNGKKLILATIFLIAASIFSLAALAKQKTPAAANNNQNADLVLYYGSTCPHCKIVENYIAQNKIANVAQKEVNQNKSNQEEFLKTAKICGLNENDLGVPALFDAKNSKCYLGDQPIIDFLKQPK